MIFKKKNVGKVGQHLFRESIRLLDYILKRESYNLNEWQSPKKAALEISMLARPLMETLRLIVYNWKLREAGLTDKEMTLSSNPITEQLCSSCADSNIVQAGPFWIVEYGPVKNNPVEQCQCPFDEKHFLLESKVKHVFISLPIQLSIDELQNRMHEVLLQCDETHPLFATKRTCK